MKTIKVLVVAAVLCTSFPLLAQSANASASGSASASANSTNQARSISASGNGSAAGSASATRRASASGSASGAGSANAQMTPVTGELAGSLDSRKAKVGDPVVLKTTRKARTADGTVIPKGSRLLGHVTAVQAEGHGNQVSQLALQFDRAQLKNGQTMAISSVLEAVNPSNAAVQAEQMSNDDMFASGPATPGPMAMGGGPVGGMRSGSGLVGGGLVGGAGNLAGGTAGAAGSLTGNAASGPRSATGALGATSGSTLSAANGSLRGASAGGGNLAAQTTGIPGVLLNSGFGGAASGVLSASKRNIHLDGGTQFVLGVTSAIQK